MNDIETKLLDQASNILSAVSNTVSKATDFASEQIPDIALQYVAWGRASYTLTFLLLIALVVAGVWVAISIGFKNRYNLADDRYCGDWNGGRIAAVVFGGLTSVVGFFLVCLSISKFLMVWVAPKVWLIKEIACLIK